MKRSHIIILVVLLLTSCSSSAAKRIAEIQGVRFSYTPALFTTVEPQTVPESVVLGAFEAMSAPHHFRFVLTSYLPKQQARPEKPEIAVYSIADFKRLNTYFSKEVLPELENLLNEKPSTLAAELKLPYILPGCCSENMQVAYFRFKNGAGVRFVTYQRGQAVLPISNASLYYIFLGLSDDGQYYLSAFLPLDVSFLPERPNSEVAAIPTRASNNMEARISATLAFNEEVVQKMTELDSADFTPPLESLDEMMQSLQVK